MGKKEVDLIKYKAREIEDLKNKLETKKSKGYLRVNKLERDGVYVLSIMNEKNDNIFRSQYRVEDLHNILKEYKRGTPIEIKYISNYFDNSYVNIQNVYIGGVEVYQCGESNMLKTLIKELYFKELAFEKGKEYYKQIEEILTEGYGRLGIVVDAATKEIKGVREYSKYNEIAKEYREYWSEKLFASMDGLAFTENPKYENTILNNINSDLFFEIVEHLESLGVNAKDNVVKILSLLQKNSRHNGGVEIIGGFEIYVGLAVRRNKECTCGRRNKYGCNVWWEGITEERFCSTCILDYLVE